MKAMITMVLVLAAVLGNYISAHALTFQGGSGSIKITGCNPDTTPADPFHCSVHEVLGEKGGSSPTALEKIVGKLTVPDGGAVLVCKNGGGNITYFPGIGGITKISTVNGADVINNLNGKFNTEHRYLNHINDFFGNVVEFRRYWGLPLERTLCRNDNWSEVEIIINVVFAEGAIYSNCTNIDDTTTCQLDATLQANCNIAGKVTATTPSYDYTCNNIVINNNP